MQAEALVNDQEDRVYQMEDYLLKEINFYMWCLDEIMQSDDLEYKALRPIYEGLLEHRRRQLAQCNTVREKEAAIA